MQIKYKRKQRKRQNRLIEDQRDRMCNSSAVTVGGDCVCAEGLELEGEACFEGDLLTGSKDKQKERGFGMKLNFIIRFPTSFSSDVVVQTSQNPPSSKH